MKNPKAIQQIDPWTYIVPTYKVTDNGIEDGEPMTIKLCRGDKSDSEKPRQEGLFTETLLQVAVEYLTSVNKGDLANRDTSIAITHTEDALLRLGKRAEDRKIRDVQGTYQK
jgi:hypothetical protein